MPTMNDFDSWKHSPVGKWFFETVLQGYADISAGENGRFIGRIEDNEGKELMTAVRNAGIIQGVEYAISIDPFEEEREELKYEAKSSRASDGSQDGLRPD